MSVTRHALTPHLAVDPPPRLRVEVSVERVSDGLALDFRVEGTLDAVQWPARTSSRRADELWRHTCFEAFVRAAGDGAYYELNASPSTEWAVYRFTGWREGMRSASECPPPLVRFTSDDASAALELRASLGWAPPLAATDWQLGIAAVLEDVRGERSFWALAHPPGEPDFHHPASFALTLTRDTTGGSIL